MSKTIKTVISSLIIGLTLAFLNPNESHFKSWMDKKFEEKLDERDASAITRAAGKILNLQNDLTTRHSSYFFFSIASATILTHKSTYLGIAGIWIPIRRK